MIEGGIWEGEFILNGINLGEELIEKCLGVLGGKHFIGERV